MAVTVAVGAPTVAAAATTNTVTQLSPTAPSRLYVKQTSSDLPYTGLDLLPETLVGAALLGAGVVTLRVRRRS